MRCTARLTRRVATAWQWAEERAIVFTGNTPRDRQLLLEVLVVFLCIVGITLTTPILLVTLAALALRLSLA